MKVLAYAFVVLTTLLVLPIALVLDWRDQR